MAAKFQETRNFPLEESSLLALVEQALIAAGFSIEFKNPQRSIILAKTKMSLWSWGERIHVEVGNGIVHIKSECSFPTQIIDWGKNKKNVHRFFEQLSPLVETDEFV